MKGQKATVNFAGLFIGGVFCLYVWFLGVCFFGVFF